MTTYETTALGRSVVAADGFDEFVRATGDRMLRTAVLLCRDRDLAEDLVQSAYATAFARWRLVTRADDPAAYTRAILTRTFLSDKRRRRVVELPLDDGVAASRGGRDHNDPTLRLSLLDALAELPPLDRAVLVLRYWEDLSVAETAHQLDITASACRTRSSRALARLRARYPELTDQED